MTFGDTAALHGESGNCGCSPAWRLDRTAAILVA